MQDKPNLTLHFAYVKLTRKQCFNSNLHVFFFSAVVEVTGCWLLELRDRYSWWHKLIPLLVTGLHDEIESIRNRAGELWDQAGRLYMQENESDQKFKDKMDYILENPTHYPPNSKEMVIKNFHLSSPSGSVHDFFVVSLLQLKGQISAAG